MPQFYDFNISDATVQLMPPDKRRNNNVSIFKAMIATPLQWAQVNLFSTYYQGSTSDQYAPGKYNKGDQVIYNKAVYESLIDDNTSDPTDTSAWFKVQDNFLGIAERIRYNGNKLTLEYALNKEYGTTFRQPNDPVDPTPSDIYITNVAAVLTGFRIGSTEAGSSSIGATTASASIGGNTPFIYTSNFQINIPSSLADDLGVNYIAIISSFVQMYAAASLKFTIQTY